MSKEYTVEQLLELAHKHRALHIKVGPLEVQLSPDAFGPAASPIVNGNAADTLPEGFKKMPTLEELQFLHAPLGPEEQPEQEPS